VDDDSELLGFGFDLGWEWDADVEAGMDLRDLDAEESLGRAALRSVAGKCLRVVLPPRERRGGSVAGMMRTGIVSPRGGAKGVRARDARLVRVF
jgi:hypothetical protein